MSAPRRLMAPTGVATRKLTSFMAAEYTRPAPSVKMADDDFSNTRPGSNGRQRIRGAADRRGDDAGGVRRRSGPGFRACLAGGNYFERGGEQRQTGGFGGSSFGQRQTGGFGGRQRQVGSLDIGGRIGGS